MQGQESAPGTEKELAGHGGQVDPDKKNPALQEHVEAPDKAKELVQHGVQEVDEEPTENRFCGHVAVAHDPGLEKYDPELVNCPTEAQELHVPGVVRVHPVDTEPAGHVVHAAVPHAFDRPPLVV